MARWKPALMEAAHAVLRAVEPFTPGALGALVAQMIRPGLGIRQRFVQWTVSVIVFHFVTGALVAVFHWPKPVADVIGFFVAFLAFEALHAIQKAAIEAGVDMIRAVPLAFRKMLESWIVRPGAAAGQPDRGGGRPVPGAEQPVPARGRATRAVGHDLPERGAAPGPDRGRSGAGIGRRPDRRPGRTDGRGSRGRRSGGRDVETHGRGR